MASYEWFVRLVELTADRVVLAHPGQLRVIAQSKRKTDKLDAQTLAEFLALDQIPEAWRPTPRVREHRVLVRHRQYLIVRRTAVMAQAAAKQGVLPRTHSFKGAVRTLEAFQPLIAQVGPRNRSRRERLYYASDPRHRDSPSRRPTTAPDAERYPYALT